MRSKGSPPQRLQTNPNLVVWPGYDLVYFIADEKGRLRDTFRLPDTTIASLLALSAPRLDKSDPRKSRIMAFDVRDGLSRSLVMPLGDQGDVVSPNPASERWIGFRIGDYPLRPPRSVTGLTKARHTLDGRDVVILDGIFEPNWVQSIYRWLFQLVYHGDPANARRGDKPWNSMLEFSPCMRFIAAVPPFATLAALSRAAMPGRRLKLQNVRACSSPQCMLSWDYREPRTDGVTAIYFGNPRWKDYWWGEIDFFREGDTEPTVTVEPKAGRLLIFDSAMVHRIAPPSTEAEHARHTLAFTFSLA
jgi:hypothetical protein